MEIEGRIENIVKDLLSGKYRITIVTDDNGCLTEAQELSKLERLVITVNRYVRHRSLNANALMWDCIGKISKAMNPPVSKWDVYLKLLRDYGTYTFVIVKPEAVEQTMKQWRESEVIGEISINGQKGVQLICYFGSSTFSSEDFQKLLQGAISEMEQLGLTPPTSEKMRRSIELWEKQKSQS